jgi:hypothetical protein
MENNDPYNGPLTEEELKNALHECKGSSPGPDDIHYELLKRMDTRERSKLLDMERRRIPKRMEKGDGNLHLETRRKPNGHRKLQTYLAHKLSMQDPREDG